jgi:hypothetical protein
MRYPSSYREAGGWLVAAVATLGFLAAVWAYLVPGNGIDHTAGALVVTGSTFLMLVTAVAVFATGWRHSATRTILVWLIALDIVCTGLAAYMLEASVLLGLMVVALVAWIVALAAPATPLPSTAAGKAVRA